MVRIWNPETATNVAAKLLDIKALKVQPNDPFTWASKQKSPVYCDNRKALSHPVRNDILEAMRDVVAKRFPETTAIVGVATGAIAWGFGLMQDLHDFDTVDEHTPFAYVRPKAKTHGLGNQIEGDLPPNSKVVVIEDLISTGGSSLAAVQALRDAGHKVLGMIAIFTYGFEEATDAFNKAGVDLYVLCDYPTLVLTGISEGYIKEGDAAALDEWRESPSAWAWKHAIDQRYLANLLEIELESSSVSYDSFLYVAIGNIADLSVGTLGRMILAKTGDRQRVLQLAEAATQKDKLQDVEEEISEILGVTKPYWQELIDAIRRDDSYENVLEQLRAGTFGLRAETT